MLEGEYGLSDICLGVPVVLGKNGIEQIVSINLSEGELAKVKESAEGVAAVNALLNL
jgi:malate dehydrogenase